MKLLASIAAATAIAGTLFIAGNPVEARNGWIYIQGTNPESPFFVKPISRSGSIITVKNRAPGKHEWTSNINCSNKTIANNDTAWEKIIDGSDSSIIYKTVCEIRLRAV